MENEQIYKKLDLMLDTYIYVEYNITVDRQKRDILVGQDKKPEWVFNYSVVT